ncbi:MAG: hypothetical protein ACRC0X_08585 [Brevinema sp.]
MLRMIQQLLPSFCTDNIPASHPKNTLISIVIDESCFLLGLEYDKLPEDLKNTLQHELISTLNQPDLSLNIVPAITLDTIETVSFALKKDNFSYTLIIPIDFLNFLSNYFGYTFYFKAQNMLDLHLEMYRFRSNFLKIQHDQYKNLFHYMLTHSLVTPKMLALFFKKFNILDISHYFSKRTAQEILEEISKLQDIENPDLLTCISYLIERNIIVFLQEHSSEHFQEYTKIINYYQDYFFRQALPHIQLERILVNLKNSPQLPLLLKSVSYQSLLSFLTFSHPDNMDFLKKGFSQQGFKILLEDLQQTQRSIVESKDFLWTLAQHSKSTVSFEDLALTHLHKDRGWEFLARECDVRDIILCLESSKIPSSGIWKILYRSYQEKIIIFPKFTDRSLITALDNCSIGINYLKILGLLS